MRSEGLTAWGLLLPLLLASGCGRRHDEGDVRSAEDSLIDDGIEIEQQDDDLEAGIEEPLSGALPVDPALGPDSTALEATLMTKVRSNPGLFFQPAGCITTTVVGNVATHVFDNCAGPYGLRTFTGTVTSTWSSETTGLLVKHQSTGFRINGSSLSGWITVTYSRNDGVIVKSRHASWTGTTAAGVAFGRMFDDEGSYDIAARCIARSGMSTASLGQRLLATSITSFKRCGVGALGCPQGGFITLWRPSAPDVGLLFAFPGGGKVEITGPQGRKFTRTLRCRA